MIINNTPCLNQLSEPKSRETLVDWQIRRKSDLTIGSCNRFFPLRGNWGSNTMSTSVITLHSHHVKKWMTGFHSFDIVCKISFGIIQSPYVDETPLLNGQNEENQPFQIQKSFVPRQGGGGVVCLQKSKRSRDVVSRTTRSIFIQTD